MLNHPDYVITEIVFPYESECPWTVSVTYKNRKNGKVTVGMFAGEADYMRVSNQCREQLGAREYVKASHAPKPKKRAVAAVAAPVKGKGKGKK